MWTVWLLVILKHNQQDIFTAISCSYSNTFSLFFLYSSSSILLLPRHVVQLWVVCCTFDTSDTEGGSPSLRTSSSHLYKKNEDCVSERQGGISEGDLIFSILFFFFLSHSFILLYMFLCVSKVLSPHQEELFSPTENTAPETPPQQSRPLILWLCDITLRHQSMPRKPI